MLSRLQLKAVLRHHLELGADPLHRLEGLERSTVRASDECSTALIVLMKISEDSHGREACGTSVWSLQALAAA